MMDKHLTSQYKVHAPTRTKVFSHFKHAFANRPNISQISKTGVAQSLDQALTPSCRLSSFLASLKTGDDI
jgi:hypothetical protein